MSVELYPGWTNATFNGLVKGTEVYAKERGK